MLRVQFTLAAACLLFWASAGAAGDAEQTGAAASSGAQPCVVDASRASPAIQQKYAAQAWQMRNDLFMRACQESHGDFIDVTDPTLGKRLVPPGGISADTMNEHYPPEAKRAHETGWVDVIFIVELDGTLSSITPVQGAKVFLEAAVAVVKSAKFRTPAYLDGKPIRSLMYLRLKWS